MIGGLRDGEFGPMLLFGLGGGFVEVLRDVAYRLLPAATDELHAMIREVRGYPLLRGVRAKAAVNILAVIQTLQPASWPLTVFPQIIALDLNPVISVEESAV